MIVCLYEHRFNLTPHFMELENELSDLYSDFRFYGQRTWAWMRDLKEPIELFRLASIEWSVDRSTLEECELEQLLSLLNAVLEYVVLLENRDMKIHTLETSFAYPAFDASLPYHRTAERPLIWRNNLIETEDLGPPHHWETYSEFVQLPPFNTDYFEMMQKMFSEHKATTVVVSHCLLRPLVRSLNWYRFIYDVCYTQKPYSEIMPLLAELLT